MQDAVRDLVDHFNGRIGGLVLTPPTDLEEFERLVRCHATARTDLERKLGRMYRMLIAVVVVALCSHALRSSTTVYVLPVVVPEPTSVPFQSVWLSSTQLIDPPNFTLREPMASPSLFHQGNTCREERFTLAYAGWSCESVCRSDHAWRSRQTSAPIIEPPSSGGMMVLTR